VTLKEILGKIFVLPGEEKVPAYASPGLRPEQAFRAAFTTGTSFIVKGLYQDAVQALEFAVKIGREHELDEGVADARRNLEVARGKIEDEEHEKRGGRA
jgi:hypothetical protein